MGSAVWPGGFIHGCRRATSGHPHGGRDWRHAAAALL